MESETGYTVAVKPRVSARARRGSRPPLEFPGCREIPLAREDLDTWEGRLEFWDGDTETAWVVREPTGGAHEHPSQRLAALAEIIASLRGSAIECFGSTDLELRDERGVRHRIMQADQTVYLHPARALLPEVASMVVGEHDFPDVVLEVDHTTDVRRGKLWLYEDWGFPEVWVEVPERDSPSRAASRRPGLTVHLLEDGEYRVSEASRTFPGWKAAEIHAAMNEASRSAATVAALERVARALGARDGTGPDDTPWLRVQREGTRAETRIEVLKAAMRGILASRGMAGPFRIDARRISGVSDEAVIEVLLHCEDERDFQARLQRLRRQPGAAAR